MMFRLYLALYSIALLVGCAPSETTRLSKPQTPDNIAQCPFGRCAEQNTAIEAPIALVGALLMVALNKTHADFTLQTKQPHATPFYLKPTVPYQEVRKSPNPSPIKQPLSEIRKKTLNFDPKQFHKLQN